MPTHENAFPLPLLFSTTLTGFADQIYLMVETLILALILSLKVYCRRGIRTKIDRAPGMIFQTDAISHDIILETAG